VRTSGEMWQIARQPKRLQRLKRASER
jgi:hypothetical protein